ncbi:MAG: glycosyltransferase family 87 protein [Micromonosporaceae bacterium]
MEQQIGGSQVVGNATGRSGRQTGAIDHPGDQETLVRGLSEPFGGPLGEHAAEPRRRFWTPVRVVLALAALLFAVHWIQKSPCQDGAWVNLEQYSRYCYTDVLALYYGEGMHEGKVPYRDHPVEYPVLTGAFMGVIGLPVHELGQALGTGGSSGINEGQWFYNINALVLCILGFGTVGALLAMRRNRPWDAAMVALAPGVLASATVNWDLLVVSLTAFALYAWSRHRPAVAGVLLGLAVAAKFYPLFLIGPLFLLALRSRRWESLGVTFGTAALTWTAVNLPVALLWRESWLRFFSFSSERGIDWGTLWYVGVHFPSGENPGFSVFHWLAGDVSRLNLAWSVLFALGCAGIAVLTFLAPRRPRLAQLAFLVIAVFLLSNKVWSQQFVLWLIPLAVLARPRWGAFLAWQVAEVGYFLAFYAQLMMASGKEVVPEWVFILASLGRMATLAALVVLVAREVLRPELDVVRDHGVDDPDGGAFDGAPDAPWVGSLRLWLTDGGNRVPRSALS